MSLDIGSMASNAMSDTLGMINSIASNSMGAVSLWDSIFNRKNVEKWNKRSFRLAQEQFEYNKQWNQEQKQWLTDMANTSHQREVEDLRAAGLNPILSGLGGSGAPMVGAVSAPHSTISYASSPSSLAAATQNVVAAASSSAKSIVDNTANLLNAYNSTRLTNATIAKLQQDTASTAKDVQRKKFENSVWARDDTHKAYKQAHAENRLDDEAAMRKFNLDHAEIKFMMDMLGTGAKAVSDLTDIVPSARQARRLIKELKE